MMYGDAMMKEPVFIAHHAVVSWVVAVAVVVVITPRAAVRCCDPLERNVAECAAWA